jgi:hypothetical protein
LSLPDEGLSLSVPDECLSLSVFIRYTQR